MKFSNTMKTDLKIYQKYVKNSVWCGTGSFPSDSPPKITMSIRPMCNYCTFALVISHGSQKFQLNFLLNFFPIKDVCLQFLSYFKRKSLEWILRRLNCLLYADDLVLISQSAEGLENALSILSDYCEHWLLSVNPKKT